MSEYTCLVDLYLGEKSGNENEFSEFVEFC